MARNRNRQPGPILRNVVEPRKITPGTSPALRSHDRSVINGPGPRRTRVLKGGMPSGNGSGLSDWGRPADLPYRLGAVAHDYRWTATING